MWPLIAAQAGMELGKGLASWFTRRKTPRAYNTALGREYLGRQVQGLYNPLARRKILNTAGRVSGTQAQMQKSRIRGGLIRRGMEGSIAGASLEAQPGLEQQKYMSDVGENMEVANEQTKQEAGLQYAGLSDQMDTQRREDKRQGLSGLLGGVVNAAGSAINTYGQEKTLGDLEGFNKLTAQAELALQSGDEDLFNEIMSQLSGNKMLLSRKKNAGLGRPLFGTSPNVGYGGGGYTGRGD